MKILAVTSGKGGVGKSTLSLNVARQLTLARKRVLLVDFDIHNKGISGLFLDKVEETTTNINAIAASSNGFDPALALPLAAACSPVSVTKDKLVLLIPALVPRGRFEWKTFTGTNEGIVRFFHAYFAAVAARLKIDVVLIDCYGGVDSLTVAAAGIAEDAIIVNEPDVITFTGTLLLYDYLKTTYPGDEDIRVHFVINRVTPKHSYRFLNDEYREHLAPLTPDRSILAYFPFDQHIVDTFGEYPFYSELMPRGLFTRKVQLLIERLWKDDPVYACFSAKSRLRSERTFRATSELRFVQPDRIIVAIVSLPGWLVVPILMLIALGKGIGGSLPYSVIVATLYTASAAILGLILMIGVVQPFLMSWWLLREARYRRRRDALTSGRMRMSLLPFAGRTLVALVPVGFSVLLLAGLTGLFVQQRPLWWNGSGRLIELSIWPGQISGIKAGGNYSGLQLNAAAQLFPARPDDGLNVPTESMYPFLGYTDFSGTHFVKAALTLKYFVSLDLRNADFSRANLRGATFINCDLRTTNFTDAALDGASFSGSHLLASNETFRGVGSLALNQDDVQNLLHAGTSDIEGILKRLKQRSALSTSTAVPLPSQAKVDDLPKIRHDLVGNAKGALVDAIEIDTIGKSPNDLARAHRELAALSSLLSNDPDIHYRGLQAMQSLLLAVRAGEPDTAPAAAWTQWLRQSSHMTGWDWSRWDASQTVRTLSHEQQRKLRLIEDAANGKISPDEFQKSYEN